MVTEKERMKPGAKGHSEKERIKILREYYTSGKSKYELGKKFGVNHSTIYRWSLAIPVTSPILHLSNKEIENYYNRTQVGSGTTEKDALIVKLQARVKELEAEVRTLKAAAGKKK